MNRLLVLPLVAAALAFTREPPSTFRIAPDALAELHRLWAASVAAKAERVACLASAIEGDTVRITRVLPLEVRAVDSLAVGAEASLAMCGPPAWQGTVHTHIALYDGHRPYSNFSGADRGVMLTWGQRWRFQGTFCLLFGESSIHCELDGPSGSVIFPSTAY
ncbi:MAG: hypothetical protein ACREL3_01940 [Gemmatimonadales bacterium]